MSNSSAPLVFTARYGRAKRLVNGLRDSEKPTECRVFQANSDGSIGKFLRTEEPNDNDSIVDNGGMKYAR